MGLRLKFNLVLLAVFLAGFLVTGYVSHRLLQKNAREAVLHNAGLMMETALAIRGYTVTQVKPHLEMQLMRGFLPQTVPAYAATETMNALRTKYPEFAYKEATLNPTNPRDRATDWEADLVQKFRNDPGTTLISGERDTPTGRSLYITRPIQIKDAACLACHTTPSAAPATMIKLYGEANGFGWKLNEIIGAQVVSVPMSLPINDADHAFYTFMISLFGVFVVIFVVLNVMLSWMIIRPIAKMSHAADQVSVGKFEISEFAETGTDEISVLASSFNRMRRSLEKAMKMIES
jgi:HAMP domain-containing protein